MLHKNGGRMMTVRDESAAHALALLAHREVLVAGERRLLGQTWEERERALLRANNDAVELRRKAEAEARENLLGMRVFMTAHSAAMDRLRAAVAASGIEASPLANIIDSVDAMAAELQKQRAAGQPVATAGVDVQKDRVEVEVFATPDPRAEQLAEARNRVAHLEEIIYGIGMWDLFCEAWNAGFKACEDAQQQGEFNPRTRTADELLKRVRSLADVGANGLIDLGGIIAERDVLLHEGKDLRSALWAYRQAQRRMLDKWAEGDDAVKAQLWRELHACEDAADAALSGTLSGSGPQDTPLEDRVREWVITRIGEVNMHPRERAMRLLEEAIELAQAEGITEAQVRMQTAHVFDREVGEPAQEASGVAVCLLGWCAARGHLLHNLIMRELERIEAKPVEEVRGSLARKRDADLVVAVPAEAFGAE